MADKEIVNLATAASVSDDILLPCYVPGSTDPAQNVTGAQLRAFAESAGKTGGAAAGAEAGRQAAATLQKGATFTPRVDPDTGALRWENDAGLENPEEVNLAEMAAGLDRDSIIEDVIANIDAPVSDYLSEELAKRSQLTPEYADSLAQLEESGDTNKLYVLPDGMIYAYMAFKTGGYTNQIPISTDTDGSVFNEVGYMEATALSGEGETKTLAEYGEEYAAATNPVFVTGLIPVENGDVIRLGNCYVIAKYDIDVSVYGRSGEGARIARYDANKAFLGIDAWTYLSENSRLVCTPDENDVVTEFTLNSSTTKYLRFTLAADADVDRADAIITVNEVIEGSGEAETYYQWASTGHAFVPADYEDRIIAAEENIDLLKKAVAGDMAVYGIVDEENNIIMTGTLAEGSYTLKYLHDDGTETEIGAFTME